MVFLVSLAVPRFDASAACNLLPSGYRYTADMLALDACKPLGPPLAPLAAPVSPFRVDQWEEELSAFPVRAFAGYIGTGLQEGFRIGFDYGAARLLSAKRNLSSASSHTAVIDKYLAKERACGRLVGPIRPDARSRVHLRRAINRVGGA